MQKIKDDIWDSIFIPIYIKASFSKAGIKSLLFFFFFLESE